MAYLDVSARPLVVPRGFAGGLLAVIAASMLLALSARAAFPLPLSPVPVTAQTFAVLLIGASLGSRLGAASVIAYIAQGVAGAPVFAAGAAGPAVLWGPTGGYLAGFVLAAFVVGWLAERGWDRRLPLALAAMALGNAAIYALGAGWLQRFVGGAAWEVGVAPFLLGDAVKIAAAALLLPAAHTALGALRGARSR